MLYTPETYSIEKALVNGCRTGIFPEITGTKKKGLKQYRRLIYNNINNAIKQAFPITHKVLSTENWNEMISDFIESHNSHTPQIWKMPGEFAEFVIKRNYKTMFSMPFLDDLLNFEWEEVVIYTLDKDSAPPTLPFQIEQENNVKTMLVNPVHKILKLAYPVHLYSVNEALNHKGEFHLLVYRTPDFKVKFVDLPVLHYCYFELFRKGYSKKEILDELKNFNDKENDFSIIEKNLNDFVTVMINNEIFINKENNKNIF